MSGVVASMRERFYHASREWHHLLGLDTDLLGARNGAKRKAEVAIREPTGPSATIVRGKRLRRMDIVGKLKEMLGAEAEFRGCQQEAIQSIMRGENFIVQVIGTGGGKSLSFMLPAWCSTGGVSIVVVPLIALRADMMERCRQFQISCAEWNSQQPSECDGKRLVFVTPESVVGETFGLWLHRRKAAQQLHQISIDECHVILNHRTDLRRQLQEMGRLSRVGTQMILLTATLPPIYEVEVWRRIEWQTLQVRLLRTAISRRNIGYRTIWLEGQDKAILQSAAAVQELLMQYLSGKAVV